MRIGEFAQSVGLTTATVRYYERRGLLDQAERASNNYRNYTPMDMRRIEYVLRARQLGLTLQEIRNLLRQSDSLDGIEVERLVDDAMGRKVGGPRVVATADGASGAPVPAPVAEASAASEVPPPGCVVTASWVAVPAVNVTLTGLLLCVSAVPPSCALKVAVPALDPETVAV